jgi:hypothetical protein
VFRNAAEAEPAPGNGEGLAQLLGSFFARWAAALRLWQAGEGGCRDVRASPWRGSWHYKCVPGRLHLCNACR